MLLNSAPSAAKYRMTRALNWSRKPLQRWSIYRRAELVLRLVDLQNGERVLSVGFEYSGKLTQPTEPVEINIPAELLEGYALKLLDSDGTETELPVTVTEDTATFTLNFDAQDEIPVRAIRLVPVQ